VKEKSAQPLVFGIPLSRSRQGELYPDGADLPLFSGTPQAVIDTPFIPQDQSYKQAMLPGMPSIDFDAVRTRDKALQHTKKRRHQQDSDLFSLPPASLLEAQVEQNAPAPLPQAASVKDNVPRKRQRRNVVGDEAEENAHHLRSALAPYISLNKLRRLVSEVDNLQKALLIPDPPEEVDALLKLCSILLEPVGRAQIVSPGDIAALLIAEMGFLQQEQLRVVCLNAKNYVQKIHLVYQGTVNSSPVRVAEVFREPLRLGSASIIVAHNHPSSDTKPSPEDVVVTREIVETGRLLGVEVLDHLIVSQGRWTSLRARKLGFEAF
jgi:hypothetical protein